MTFPENSHKSAHWFADWPQAHFCSFSQKSIKMASAFIFSNQSDPVKLSFEIAQGCNARWMQDARWNYYLFVIIEDWTLRLRIMELMEKALVNDIM